MLLCLKLALLSVQQPNRFSTFIKGGKLSTCRGNSSQLLPNDIFFSCGSLYSLTARIFTDFGH